MPQTSYSIAKGRVTRAMRKRYRGRTVYVDSSVILRLVLGEPDSLGDWHYLSSLICSALAEVECLRSLDRLRHMGRLDEAETSLRRATVLALLSRIDRVELTPQVLSRASNPFPTALGSLDALHLATAMLWREQRGNLIFATHDRQLAEAARATGFEVIGV